MYYITSSKNFWIEIDIVVYFYCSDVAFDKGDQGVQGVFDLILQNIWFIIHIYTKVD